MEQHRRYHASSPSLRTSLNGRGRVLVGYAAVFNERTVIERTERGVLYETISPGAFSYALGAGQDVRCLFNHNSDAVLGRVKAGTLRLKEDSRGLMFEVDLPDTQLGRDLATLVERGDVSGCSFAFTPREDGLQRKINNTPNGSLIYDVVKSVDLYDVGPVTFPAYQGTSAIVRGGLALDDKGRKRLKVVVDCKRRLHKMKAAAMKFGARS